MRSDFMELVNRIDEIKLLLKEIPGNKGPHIKTINNNPEFSLWKQSILLELQSLYDENRDNFIWQTIVKLKQGFNGWHDEASLNELSGSLLAMKKNIDKYYPPENNAVGSLKGACEMNQKRTKVFISHSSKDDMYINSIVGLLEGIGLKEEHLFCSSVAGYSVPHGENIYDYLRTQFQEYNIYAIFVLSKNYYNSVACMNEMGAAWVLQNVYATILLPGFDYSDIEGAINPRQIGIKLDSKPDELKERLGQLKDVLVEKFQLAPISAPIWEKKRDEFILKINTPITQPAIIISPEAQLLLETACEDKDGQIIRAATMSGIQISVKNRNFINSQERREVAKWEQRLKELVDKGYVESQGKEGGLHVVTEQGYEFVEKTHG